MANREIDIKWRWNTRDKKEFYITGHHVNLQTLKEEMERQHPENHIMNYLNLNIPPYPTPVEFWVSDVAHVTVKAGFEGIMESEGFRPKSGEFSWWGLKITGEEVKEAEKRYRENHQVNQEEEFLHNFITSPAFKNESRYGNYRFTFPLTDLMNWYKEQNCGGEEPVLRVYETVTYSQEIMYTVLIHSPEDNKRFGEYPLLTESDWVRYEDGKIIWKAQAICGTHEYQIVDGEAKAANLHLKYYVWDHVSLVFHLPNAKTLKIPTERLKKAFSACKLSEVNLSRCENCFTEAEEKEREFRREREEE